MNEAKMSDICKEIIKILRSHIGLDMDWAGYKSMVADNYCMYLMSGLVTMQEAKAEGCEAQLEELRAYISRRGKTCQFEPDLSDIYPGDMQEILPDYIMQAGQSKAKGMAYAVLSLSLCEWAAGQSSDGRRVLPLSLLSVAESLE